MAAAPPTPEPGDVLAGKYRIERPLGEGGMAVVFAATHLALDRPVALKFVRPWALGEDEVRQRFLREAHATFSLRSEHAVRMLDLGELPSGELFLVMELLEGQNLSELLQSRGPIPEVEAALLIRQACDAIAEAHALGIVHRDLKPANLFLATTPTGRPCIKVLDFGLAKISGGTGPGSMVPLTNVATTLGTPKYMAPEQWERSARVDGRADIYALGMILFQLLTGRVPHEELPLDERLRMILAGAVPSPRGIRPEISESMARVVMRCLRPLPDERFATAQELADALAYAEAGPAVSRPAPAAFNSTGITAVVPDAVRRAVQREVAVNHGHASAAAASVSPADLAMAQARARAMDDGGAPPTRIESSVARAPSAAAPSVGVPGTSPMGFAPPGPPPPSARAGAPGTMPLAAYPEYGPESVRTEKMDRPAFLQEGQVPNAGDQSPESGRGLNRTLMSNQGSAPMVMPAAPAPVAIVSAPPAAYEARGPSGAPPAHQAPGFGAVPISAPAARAYAPLDPMRTTDAAARFPAQRPAQKKKGAGLVVGLVLVFLAMLIAGGALAFFYFRGAFGTSDASGGASAVPSGTSAAPILAPSPSASASVAAPAPADVPKRRAPTHAAASGHVIEPEVSGDAGANAATPPAQASAPSSDIFGGAASLAATAAAPPGARRWLRRPDGDRVRANARRGAQERRRAGRLREREEARQHAVLIRSRARRSSAPAGRAIAPEPW